MTSTITTHILDLQTGKPAVGMIVRLQQLVPIDFVDIADGVTNEDGRILNFGGAEVVTPGIYRLRFETGLYFNRIELAEFFYPSVTVEFQVTAARSHYHVPLLLSPFGYSTYRGS